MPEISRFYGIIVRMYYEDHNPPHVHVRYGGEYATVRISPPGLVEGKIRGRALALVIEWCTQHEEELLECWRRASSGGAPFKIAPLE